MKKLFLLMLIACMTGGCSWFDIPANAKLIGSGYIQKEKGLYFVEIDSLRYATDYIYTGTSNRAGKGWIEPVEGMLITCFTLYDDDRVQFIVGERSEEYLEEYFDSNATIWVILGCLLLCAFLCNLIPDKKRKVVQAD